MNTNKVKVQNWTDPESSRRSKLPNFKTIAGKLSALRTDRLYPSGNIVGTHFC